MPDPEDVLSDSPADFDSSFAYALHGEMRRLIIVTILGTLLFPVGLALFFDPNLFGTAFDPIGERLFRRLFGLVITIVGAAFLYGGFVAVLFKIVTDANIMAVAETRGE